MTAALGFAGIPPEVFAAVFNYAEDGGTIAFNPMDEFLEEKDPSGVAETIEDTTDSVSPENSMRAHLVHRRWPPPFSRDCRQAWAGYLRRLFEEINPGGQGIPVCRV